MSCAMSTSELIVDYEHFTMSRALIMKLIVQPVRYHPKLFGVMNASNLVPHGY